MAEPWHGSVGAERRRAGEPGANDLANNIVIGSGANAIQLASGNNLTLTGTLLGNGSLTLGNSGNASSLYLSGANAMSGGMVVVANNANYVRFASPARQCQRGLAVPQRERLADVVLILRPARSTSARCRATEVMQGNVIGSMNVTLQVGGNNNPATFSGVIHDNGTGTGPIGLTKIGSGTQWLTGACDYSGATVVSTASWWFPRRWPARAVAVSAAVPPWA